MREWGSGGGNRRDFMVGCLLAAAAAVLSCEVRHDRWIAPHFAVRTLFGAVGGLAESLSRFGILLYGLLPGCLLLLRVGV